MSSSSGVLVPVYLPASGIGGLGRTRGQGEEARVDLGKHTVLLLLLGIGRRYFGLLLLLLLLQLNVQILLIVC